MDIFIFFAVIVGVVVLRILIILSKPKCRTKFSYNVGKPYSIIISVDKEKYAFRRTDVLIKLGNLIFDRFEKNVLKIALQFRYEVSSKKIHLSVSIS
ncbi:hypothetical protein DWV68_14095 [Roseburia sp. AF12-17LB]|nr:hypothetical protein DWV68_14095 [Roseburia sp. AF12-17LB]